jgi:Flp pilus assembly protein TadG
MHTARWLRATRWRADYRVASPRPPRLAALFRRRRPRSRGQAVVEFAIILPVFLLLLVIAIDFGRLFFTYIQVHNAAREGAAVGSYSPTDTAAITTRVQAEKNSQAQRGENPVTVTTACADASRSPIACTLATGGAGAGNTITVNVRETFSFLTPLINGFFGSNLQMTASATSTVLGYAAGPGGGNPGSCSLPTANFVWSITSGRTILANPSSSTPNSGICNISGYNWTWGDTTDSVGTATGDTHTFPADGSYQVTLEVTNQAGANEQTQTVVISTGPPPPVCAKPTANFTWTKSGKTYTYRDASTVADPTKCPVSDWLWTFTDNGGLQSNVPNPSPVTYGNNSAHSVTLKVTNAGGSTTITLST